MHFDQYQSLAMRTRGIYPNKEEQIKASCLGIAGESGELIDMVKKQLFHQKPITKEAKMKEVGDILWYLAQYCDAEDMSMNDAACLNIKKLEERYPQGFNYFAANNRKPEDT